MRSGVAIAASLHGDVDEVVILVDGPPEILTAALNIHEQLVQTPGVAQSSAPMPEPPSVGGTKGLTPVPNRFVRHRDTPLGQQVLGIAKTDRSDGRARPRDQPVRRLADQCPLCQPALNLTMPHGAPTIPD